MDEKIMEMLEKMDAKIDALQAETSAIRLTIENEIRTNISIIAEGHASLDRKMGYIITDMAKLSQMEIRLNTALSEISQLKKAVGIG